MENISGNKQKMSFSQIWEKFGTLTILVLLVILIAVLSPKNSNFLTGANIINIMYQSTDKIIIGLGEFFPILIAGIDLSVGSILALTGLLAGKLMNAGISVGLAVFLGCIVAGAAMGALNGFLVNFTKVHPFIITLGTNWVFRGLIMIISDARAVSGFPPEFKASINYRLFGQIPMAIIIALILAAILWFMTTKTKMGRNIYAYGGNKEAAWFSGINIDFYTIIVFVISGICAGIAGMVITAKTGAAEPLAATGYETFAIAAAIIGGTSFFGGKGRIWNVVIGGLVIGLINNGLNMMRVETFYQQVVMGALIIAAVSLDTFIMRQKK
ncbi:MAG: D-allose ABC transporter permease [Brevefilum sp.]|jgi:D-allose transport system permease protein